MKFLQIALLAVAAQAIMLNKKDGADQQGPPPMCDGEHSDNWPSREEIMAKIMEVDGKDGDGMIDIHEAKRAAEELGAVPEEMDEILAPWASGKKLSFDEIDTMLKGDSEHYDHGPSR